MREREKEAWGEADIDLFSLFMHSFLDSCMCLDWTSISQPRAAYWDGTLTRTVPWPGSQVDLN